jgi:hypothetical protein
MTTLTQKMMVKKSLSHKVLYGKAIFITISRHCDCLMESVVNVLFDRFGANHQPFGEDENAM